jgi:hypothetical protein
MDFSINNYVRIKLTDHGRAVHAADHVLWCARHNCKLTYQQPEEDADGWSRWQMWALMEAFGHHVGNGFTIPFETTIQIVTEKSIDT